MFHHGDHQGAHSTSRGELILDDPTAARAERPPRPGPGFGPLTGAAPKGIREQLSATIEAALRVGRAHVGLARAELGEIAAEGKRVGILAGIASGCSSSPACSSRSG